MKRPTKTEFPRWLRETMPIWKWSWRHQKLVYEKLHLVTTGKCRRLMIFMPPRHGKSETVTVRYTAWRLEKDPTLNVILGSYNQKLANRFSRKIRRIVEGRVALSKDRKAVDEWETSEGGGVRAVGAGAGITGFGGRLVVIDDPVKNRAEAESLVRRDNTWDWFSDDVYTRLEPKAAIILIQTRWHEDDLAGRLIKKMEHGGEQWEILSLAALAEARNADTLVRKDANASDPRNADTLVRKDANASDHGADVQGMDAASGVADKSVRVPSDPLGRAPGEALWPERFDVAALGRIREQQGSYSFAALYQQQPMPSDGGHFKRGWFRNIIESAPEGLRWVRGYDLAVSTRTSADYTASFRCAYDREGNFYIADGLRRRLEYPDQRRYVLERLAAERDTIHCVENALHGQALVQDIRRDARGVGRPVRAVKVDGDKVTRALTWAPLAESGKLFLVRGAWIDEFVSEACAFPNGRFDDQIDAVSLAVAMLRKATGRLHLFD